jgi:hypothetical protein
MLLFSVTLQYGCIKIYLVIGDCITEEAVVLEKRLLQKEYPNTSYKLLHICFGTSRKHFGVSIFWIPTKDDDLSTKIREALARLVTKDAGSRDRCKFKKSNRSTNTSRLWKTLWKDPAETCKLFSFSGRGIDIPVWSLENNNLAEVLYIFHVSNDQICINHLEEERYIYINHNDLH